MTFDLLHIAFPNLSEMERCAELFNPEFFRNMHALH